MPRFGPNGYVWFNIPLYTLRTGTAIHRQKIVISLNRDTLSRDPSINVDVSLAQKQINNFEKFCDKRKAKEAERNKAKRLKNSKIILVKPKKKEGNKTKRRRK